LAGENHNENAVGSITIAKNAIVTVSLLFSQPAHQVSLSNDGHICPAGVVKKRKVKTMSWEKRALEAEAEVEELKQMILKMLDVLAEQESQIYYLDKLVEDYMATSHIPF